VIDAASGGAIVGLGAWTFRAVGRWQEGRRDVDAQDHKLLHDIADVILDQAPTVFNPKGTVGILTRMGNFEGRMDSMEHVLNEINQKVP
jgi:hypothetical protein